MTTERKQQAARANGAKSRGPVTPEGKARSSKNATTNGLTAETVLLPDESQERFNALLGSMIEAYRPSTDYEVSVVEKMAALNWQQDRLLGIDTATLAVQIEVMAPALDAELEHLSPPARIALAYRDLSDNSRVLSNLDRHASRIRRQFNQLRTELLSLQKLRPDSQPRPEPPVCNPPSPADFSIKLQNEPTGEQPPGNEQHANPEAVPRTSAPAAANSATAAPVSTTPPSNPAPQPEPEPEVEPQPSSARGIKSTPDASASAPNKKLQNEPTAEQLPSNHPLAKPETEPQIPAAQIETRTFFANEAALAKARAALLRMKFA